MGLNAKQHTRTTEINGNRQIPLQRKAKRNFSGNLNSPVEQILHLQRTVGNPVVQRLIESGVIQAKLTVGQPNDMYEREADQLADRVMHITDTSLVNDHSSSVQRIQTKPLAEQITPFVQRQSLEEEDEPVQAKSASPQTPAVTPGIESSINSLRGGGQPLPESTRSFFEPRFGTDFSRVRIHNGPRAAVVAKSVNARAFTLSNHVVFGAGEYSPATESGKRLLAHELTHVVQQRGNHVARSSMLQRAVAFSTDFNNINLSQNFSGAISGDYFTYKDAQFSADAEIKVTGDSEAELDQWDIGILQNMNVNWDRNYWKRDNTDRKGRFVEKKFKHINISYRDQVNGATTVWYADSKHKLLSTLPKTKSGNKYEVSTTINTSDAPRGGRTIHGSSVLNMDASDGTRNIQSNHVGSGFKTFISAHNTVTGAWRHLKLLDWNYQRELTFKGTGASLAVDNETGAVTKYGPYNSFRSRPLTSGTTANTAVNDGANYSHKRVNGWT